MDEDIVLFITATITTLGVGGLGLGAFHIWVKSKAQRLSDGAREELAGLRQSIEDLRQEVHGFYGELHSGQQELNERIDFAERLLIRGHSDASDE